MGHCSHALKNLDPGVGARFRRMNQQNDHRNNEWRCLDCRSEKTASDIRIATGLDEKTIR